MSEQAGSSGDSSGTTSGGSSAPTTPPVASVIQPQLTSSSPQQALTPVALQQHQQQTPNQPQTPTQQLQAVQPQQIQPAQPQIQPQQLQPQGGQLQQVQAGAQMQQIPTANAVVRSSLPAQVQVIQPMGATGGPYVSQQYVQQQLMLQNATGLQTMQPQTLNPQQLGQVNQVNQLNQVCPVSVTLTATPKSPGLMSPTPQASMSQVRANVSSVVGSNNRSTTMLQAKGTTGIAFPQPQQPQSQQQQQQQQQGGANQQGQQQTATPLYNHKQVIQHRPGAQPVVIGQLAGVLANQQVGNQTIQVTQPKSPAITLQGSMPQSPVPSQQVFSSPTQIRFTGHQTFVTNNGQILGGNLNNGAAMINQFQGFQAAAIQQQGIPLVTTQHQGLIAASQNATILTTQPLYLRAAGPIHTPHGIVGNVQAVAPTKGKQMSSSSASSSSSHHQPLKGIAHHMPRSIPSSSSSNSSASSQPSALGDSARVRGLVHSKNPGQVASTTQQQVTTVNAQGLRGVVKTISTVQGLKTISTVQGVKTLTLGQSLKALNAGTVTSSTSAAMATGTAAPNMHGVQQGLQKGVANILPQGTRTVAPSGGQIQQLQVAPTGVAVQPQVIKTIQPLQQQLGQQPPGVSGSGGGQKKQVSKVKAMSVQPKANSPQPTAGGLRLGQGQQARVGLAGRPPMVMVQPKPQQQTVGASKAGGEGSAAAAKSSGVQAASATGSGPSQGAAAAASSSTGAASASAGTTGPIAPTEIKQEEMDTTGPGAAPASASSTTQNGPIPPSQQNGSAAAEKHMEKPNVLTHVIEGFIIQEAPEPFPVQRSSVLSDLMSIHSSDFSDSENADKDSNDENSDRPEDLIKLRCEFCGRMEPHKRFRRSKRFCSVACAKRYNVGCTRRMGLFQSRHRAKLASISSSPFVKKKKFVLGGALAGGTTSNGVKKTWKRAKGGRVSTGPIQRTSETPVLTAIAVANHTGSASSSISSLPLGDPLPSAAESSTETERSTSPSAQEETSSAPRSPPELERVEEVDQEGMEGAGTGGGGDTDMPPPPTNRHPSLWNVQDVYDFILSLPGCECYADEFCRQEIDGQALMLLKEDHLMTTMNIKLGPALKICNRINTLKDELS